MKILSAEEFRIEYNRLTEKHKYTEACKHADIIFVTYPGEETIAMRCSEIEG
jgi:hypothetical protein